MAITKLSHVKERSSGNPNAGLYACIDYILNPEKQKIGGLVETLVQQPKTFTIA